MGKYTQLENLKQFRKCLKCKHFNKVKMNCYYPGPGACILIDKELSGRKK